AERTAYMCLLLPDAGDHLRRAAGMADRALAGSPGWAVPYAQFAKGLSEYRQDRLESAQEWLEKSLVHAPPGWHHPVPHLVLAMIAQRRGQPDVARERLAEAAALSRYEVPDADMLMVWVSQILRREAETLIELGPKLAALRRGEVRLESVAERVALARQCVDHRQFPVAAARLFAEAFAADPRLADDRDSRNRYHAACSAARAGTGHAEETETLDDQEQARWRQQARTWLRAELAVLAGQAERSD